MEKFKIHDRVLVKGKFHGTICNINDYREPTQKYAIDLDEYKEDVVFCGEEDLQHLPCSSESHSPTDEEKEDLFREEKK